jgi:hypothetical protein
MDIRINKVWFDADYIYIKLSDERIIGNPIRWFRNLAKGTPEQREQYKIIDNGEALRWDELDEDLSAKGFINTNDTD